MTEENTVQQIKDAKEREAEKTRQQRAEDIAYTINHAISCGATDIFVQPYISAWVTNSDETGKLPKWLSWTKNIFESHEHHGHDHDHEGHDDHKPGKHVHTDDCEHRGSGLGKDKAKKTTGFHCEEVGHTASTAEATEGLKNSTALKKAGSFWHNLMHWVTGEIVGDVGAVPLTIAVQRFAPNFMQGIRTTLEPVASPMFRSGAAHSAKEWGKHNGYAADSDEVKAKEAAMYEHEIGHLPQALVWNCFSFPINIGAQAVMFKKTWADIPLMVVAKTFGAVFSNTALIGGRAFVPDTASDWDKWSGKHIVIPTTKVIGGLFGVDSETVDRVAKKQAEAEAHGSWKDREDKKRVEPTVAASSQALG